MTCALITGCTSGLGLEFAWQLAGSGHDLVLTARNGDRLRAIAAQIESLHHVSTEVIAADLSERDELERVARRLTDPVEPVDLLINNAGYGLHTSFLDTDIQQHEIHLDTQVRAILVLSHTAASSMVQRRRGAIINVSSLAGYTSSGTFAAAKSWVTAFTETLAEELQGTGVTATAVLPGFVETDAHERAAMNSRGLPRITWLKAPFVVQQALRDAARGQVLSIPTLKQKAASEVEARLPRGMVTRILGPRWTARINEKQLEKARKTTSLKDLTLPWAS